MGWLSELLVANPNSPPDEKQKVIEAVEARFAGSGEKAREAINNGLEVALPEEDSEGAEGWSIGSLFSR